MLAARPDPAARPMRSAGEQEGSVFYLGERRLDIVMLGGGGGAFSRGVEVEDPAGAGREKVGSAQVDAELDGLATSVQELGQRALDDRLAERKSDLVARSAEADFWDDQAAAA